MRRTMLVLILTGLFGCGGGGSSSPTAPSGGGSTTSTTITIPLSDGYGNSSFSPVSITIAAGGSVTWTNRDNVAHNSTSNTGAWAGDIPAGGDYTRAFATKGTYAYHCSIHNGMTGTINVQ